MLKSMNPCLVMRYALITVKVAKSIFVRPVFVSREQRQLVIYLYISLYFSYLIIIFPAAAGGGINVQIYENFPTRE